MSTPDLNKPLGISGRVAAYFLKSPLTPLLAIGAVLLGVFALVVTPREEEPQVNVTMATVTIPFPGASAKQVEQMVAIPAEQLLSQIADVEHVMSVSRPGVAMMTLQFEVGLSRTEALVRLHDVIQSNKDFLPAGSGIGEPIVKSKGIDDVPIMGLTLYSNQPGIGAYELERVAHALELELKQVSGTREVTTVGGPGRRVSIDLDSARMRAAGVTVADLRRALKDANFALPTGDLIGGNRSIAIEAGTLIGDAIGLPELVVGVHEGRPVLLGDVAKVSDDPPAPEHYVWHGVKSGKGTKEYPAVTIEITKKPGQDASLIAFEVKRKLDSLKNTLIPPSIDIAVTRDYGAIGVDKALRLIYKLLFATTAVVVLVWLMLSWREALLVAVAVVLTLLLMLFASWAIGYTLNRVSLFALIFAVGILVDDAIVIAENIHRHIALSPGKPLTEIIPYAVDEVGGPTILATFTVIAALMPILAVTGMMGGFGHPIGITPSIGMVLSLAVAFIVTPWMARLVLKPAHHGDTLAAKAAPILRKLSKPFLTGPRSRRNRLMLFAVAPLLIVLALQFAIFKATIVRVMPFDNRNELQVVVDLPSDSPVERTAAVLREVGQYVAAVPEVKDYQAYAGVPAPIDFNGLARQYYLRESGEYGTVQVNLVGKHDRKASSHEIAARIRPELHRIAARYDAILRVVESPAGPPSYASVTAEIYGPDDAERLRIAQQVKKLFTGTRDMDDIVDSSIAATPKRHIVIDRRKAATLGVAQQDIVTTLRAGLGGEDAAFLHDATKYPAPLRLQLPAAERVSIEDILRLTVHAGNGSLVPIGELVEVRDEVREQPIFHKDLKPVVFVGGDMGGHYDSPLYAMFPMRDKLHAITTPGGGKLRDNLFFDPSDTQSSFSVRWDGEWRTSYETFRDLGVAFVVAMVLIYLLIVAHFGSYLIPLIIMIPIPLTLIGVLPGHWITGAQFSATSGIGMLALAGIIVRNAILLVDFIRIETGKGKPLRDAVIDAPLVRAQPILLTALAAMLSGYFILGDQTFDGLGTTLIFGVFASTLLTLVLIPLLYYHFYYKKIP
jgi:multidrug efflux pump subunit AcrB